MMVAMDPCCLGWRGTLPERKLHIPRSAQPSSAEGVGQQRRLLDTFSVSVERFVAILEARGLALGQLRI